MPGARPPVSAHTSVTHYASSHIDHSSKDAEQTMSKDAAPPPYEAPEIRVLGTLHELTLRDDFCFFGKSLGSPDYWNRIPVSNCSS